METFSSGDSPEQRMTASRWRVVHGLAERKPRRGFGRGIAQQEAIAMASADPGEEETVVAARLVLRGGVLTRQGSRRA